MSVNQLQQNNEVIENKEVPIDQRFDNIYNKLKSKNASGGAVTFKYQDSQWVDISIVPFGVSWEYINWKEDIKSWWKGISIERHKTPDIKTRYELIKYNNWSFSLRTMEMMGDNNQNIDNLDINSVNKILWNFEKRIWEAENSARMDEYKKIEKANQLAQNEEWDIDNWLEQNLV